MQRHDGWPRAADNTSVRGRKHKHMNAARVVSHVVMLAPLLWAATLLLVAASACAEEGGGGELVFQTGFEGTCQVVSSRGGSDKITGVDTTLAECSDWEKDIEQKACAGPVYINYTGGDPSKRFAKIIPEPGNPDNKVLWYWLDDTYLASENTVKGRVQVDLYRIRGGWREFYQSVRVFLHPDFNVLKDFPQRIRWLTISEFWNNEWWVKDEPYGFRITLGIGKSVAGPGELEFILDAQDAGMKQVWKADAPRVRVPVGQWFTMEYYVKEGDKGHGRFWMAITPESKPRQVVFDVTNYTHNTHDPAPNGFTGYNPMKLYTSKELVAFMRSQGKTLQIYWDDLKIWTGKTPTPDAQ